MNILIWCLYGALSFGLSFLHADASKEMLDLKDEINKKLIDLRTNDPKIGSQVYSILDNVGKLHAQAQELCKKHLVLEQKVESKDIAFKAVSDEFAVLKSKFMQARNEVKQMAEKLAKNQAEQEKKKVEKKVEEESMVEKVEEEPKEQATTLTQNELDFKNKLLSKMNKKNELNNQQNI